MIQEWEKQKDIKKNLIVKLMPEGVNYSSSFLATI